MNIVLLNQIFFPIFILVTFISIFGYGLLFNSIFFKNKNFLNFKNLIFIKGLFFTGTVCIFINIYFPISDLISSIIIIIGVILYSFFL